MNAAGWIQLLLFCGALLAITKPLGIYLTRVLDPDRGGGPFLARVLGPVERLVYTLLRVDPKRDQNWKQYTVAVLLFSVVGMLLTYGILRTQDRLPLNPQKLGPVAEALSFNTAASFATNTNWQSYGGESTLSYLSQMVALTFHNFTSAAVGISIAAVIVRGVARHQTKGLGNFWADIVRVHLYVLLPMCLLYATFLVSQGVIQNFREYTAVTGIDGQSQTIAQGPVASQVAIKMLGTNGGGYFNANAAQPFENPTPLSNFVQMLSIFAIPAGLTYYLGRMTQRQAHGWAVFAAMSTLFFIGVIVCWSAESAGNPRLASLGVDPTAGNLEGKEVRFGVFNSSLFATVTTAASCGAVNSMHDSFTPIGGLVPLFNLHLGEVIFGGVGAGLYGMLIFVVLTIFIAGLMVGRTPEYLGKKIEAFDVKCAVLGILAPSLVILAFTAWAVVSDWGTAGLNNAGPHGLTEILYAFSSAAANNGSAFAGLTATPANGDPHYNVTLAIAMLVGRFFIIVPVLALAGSLGAKKLLPQSSGSFPVTGAPFTLILIAVIVIVGALTFLPALALGPIVEHFLMHGSNVTF